MQSLKRCALLLVGLFLVGGPGAWASSTRSIDADQIQNSGHTVTTTIPAQTGTLMISAGIVQEVPSGTINGSNTAFTFSATPASAAVLQCWVDGILQRPTTDYSFSGTALTMVTAPAAGQDILCKYSKF